MDDENGKKTVCKTICMRNQKSRRNIQGKANISKLARSGRKGAQRICHVYKHHPVGEIQYSVTLWYHGFSSGLSKLNHAASLSCNHDISMPPFLNREGSVCDRVGVVGSP